MLYNGWPYPRASVIFCNHRFSIICPSVCGNDMIEAAKMTGITPPVLSRSGR